MNAVQESGCKKFLKLLATEFKFNIITGADCPATNSNTVYLPDLRPLTVSEVNGFAFHEALHLKYTNFGVLDGLNYPEIIKAVFNALEDTRIERMGVGALPGGQTILNGRIEAMLNRGHRWFTDGNNLNVPVQYAFPTYVCLFGKVNFLNSPAALAQHLAEGRTLLVKYLGEPVMKQVDALMMRQTMAMNNTKAALELARDICSLIAKEANGQAQSQDSAVDRKGSATRNGRKSLGSDLNLPSSVSGQSPGQQSGSGDGQQTTESQREFMRQLLSADDATNKASNRIGGKEPRPISDRPFEDYSPCSWSAEGEEALKLKPMAEKPLKPEEFWAVVKPVAERIRTMLDNILRTQTRSGIYFSSNGRRVNNTVISRLAVGNPRIMEKRLEPRTGLDTAVALLLDTSGSMGRKRMQAARDASAALIAAVRQLKGCNASMRVFPGTSFSKAVKSKLLIPMGHSNLSATDVNRLCHVESWGATPILHALCAGISELEGRTESRKVIILITDGTTFGQDPDLAKAWKKRAEASGIEIFTLMLGDDADCEGNRALSTRFAFLDDNETSDTVTGTPAMVRCISQFAVQGIFGPR